MKYYFFDFDGTLADSGEAAVIAIQKAFQKQGYRIPTRAEIDYYMGIPIEVSFPKMTRIMMTDDELHQLMDVFRSYYKQIEEKYLTLFDGIRDVLKELTNCHKHLFVVSSKHSNALIRNLEQLDIKKYFEDVSGSDNVSNYKPHPEGILSLIEKHHINPNESIRIGDAIFDIQMGQSAHIQTAAVSWGAHDIQELRKEHPDYILTKPIDILSIQ